ncbi:MAG: PIN domain-containing protein [Pirellulaceae bacterium]|nr:PIN domain-containing protein [Pirellulaceae bacterium]
MGIVVDTGVLIHWERRSPSTDQTLIQLDRPAFISVVTASELLVGVHRADTWTRREARSRFVEALLTQFAILPVSLVVARQHAALSTELSQNGTPIGYHDAWIAATALCFGSAIMTTNVREFAQVPGLEVVPITTT